LEKNLFKNFINDQFTTKVACNAEEACKLLEVGFEYVTGEMLMAGKSFANVNKEFVISLRSYQNINQK